MRPRNVFWTTFLLLPQECACASSSLGAILAPRIGFSRFKCPDMLSYIIPSALYCQLCRTAATEGSISDCSCDFDTVDTATHDYYHPLLRRLQSQKFFRFFKINLDESCPFWDDSDSMCAMKDCSVETCKSDEVPLPWRAEDKSGAVSSGRNSSDSVDSGSSESSSGSSDGKPPLCKPVDSVYSAESEMDRKSLLAEQNVERATARIFDGSLGVSRWNEGGDDSDVWIEQDEATGMVYVDLEQNPERFTGYTGDSPHRIWQAIYEENCFESSDEENSGSQCFEKRIFYRLISGMQASITTHIAKGYFYGTNYGEQGYWAPNTELFVERVGKYPDRLHNLYFTYLFVMRAVAKAGPDLDVLFSRGGSSFSTGDASDDSATRALVRALVYPDHPLIKSSNEAQVCQRGFDESRLFDIASFRGTGAKAHAGGDGRNTASFEEAVSGSVVGADNEVMEAAYRAAALRQEFQGRFRNISRIMDCVGCEKCRLWGKLQVLGIGTALKVLLSQDELALSEATLQHGYSLQRNEVIALIQTLGQLSASVQSVREWRRREVLGALGSLGIRLIALIVGPWALLGLLRRRRKRARQLETKN